jgi:hypothetical protein
MNFTLERVTQPDIEPVTLAEMKRHLRCQDGVTVQDDDITALIVAAREWVEDYTARALIDQTWLLTIGDHLQGDRVRGYNLPIFSGGFSRHEWLRWMRRGEIMLRRSPILAVTSFKSIDAAGVVSNAETDTYALREPKSKWPRLVLMNGVTWPTGTLQIEFRAGFANRIGSPKDDASVVPTRFRQAMKLWAEANYDRDQFMMALLLKVAEQIIKPERADLSLA